MKFISKNEDFTLFVCEKIDLDFDSIHDYLKKLKKKIKQKHNKNISGFYTVNVYKNDKFGVIFDFKKEEYIDFLNNLLDLDISLITNNSIFLEFDDVFLIKNFNNVYFYNNKFYIDIDLINKTDFYKLIEFSNIIYGEELEKIRNKFNLLIQC